MKYCLLCDFSYQMHYCHTSNLTPLILPPNHPPKRALMPGMQSSLSIMCGLHSGHMIRGPFCQHLIRINDWELSVTICSVCWNRLVRVLSAHNLRLPWTHIWSCWALNPAFLFVTYMHYAVAKGYIYSIFIFLLGRGFRWPLLTWMEV